MRNAGIAPSAFVIVSLLWVLPGAAARCEPTAVGSSRNVTVTLVPEHDGLATGRSIWVGLHFKLAPEWHTYWKNPGDSGLPIRVSWTLPEGYAAGSSRWPLPERFAAGPLMSYGYAREALLLTEIRPAGAATSEKEVRIGARVEWLECQEACLPGKAELEVALPVRRDAPRPLPEWAATFRKFRERLPRVEPRLRAEAAVRGADLVLTLRGLPAPARAYFFPASAEVIDHGAAQPLGRDASAFTLRLRRAANAALPARIAGVLEADGSAYEIQAPVRSTPLAP